MASRLLVLAAAAARALAGPCDIFASSGTPCVAAHAVSRALYASYAGPLYRVARADGGELDVLPLAGGAGGVADAAAVDAFCPAAAGGCNISVIYDQRPQQNHLVPAPPGGEVPRPDKPVNASKHASTLAGKKVYAAWFEGGMGYRNDTTSEIAVGNEEETLYMVTSGTHVNGGCCFDCACAAARLLVCRRLAFRPPSRPAPADGNAETNNHDTGAASMESVYFGTSTGWGRGAGAGPWVMADMENGLFAGNNKVNNANTPLTSEFVTAMVKGGANGFALKGADATQGAFKTMYDGARPNGYQPMKKQGAIILGIGGTRRRGEARRRGWCAPRPPPTHHTPLSHSRRR
jgi:hypothetical protein